MRQLRLGFGLGKRIGKGTFLLVDGSGNVIVDEVGDALAVNSASEVENA